MFSATAALGRVEFACGVGFVLELGEDRVAAGLVRVEGSAVRAQLVSAAISARSRRSVGVSAMSGQPFGYCQVPTLAFALRAGLRR
jgi:hypothetical protein